MTDRLCGLDWIGLDWTGLEEMWKKKRRENRDNGGGGGNCRVAKEGIDYVREQKVATSLAKLRNWDRKRKKEKGRRSLCVV